MPKPAADTKLIEAATQLMLSQGYSSTTVDAICEKAGVTKGSFYHYFDSKEELGIAVLQRAHEDGARILGDGAYQNLPDPVQRALGYLRHAQDCSLELWKNGCLLGTFSLDLADTNPRMQQTVSALFGALSHHIAGILQPVVDASTAEDTPTALELADQFLSSLEGAIILAKAHRKPELIAAGIHHFRRYIQTFLAPATVPA
jgi:TetR/AcrR family transcriptional repressor of nem operon